MDEEDKEDDATGDKANEAVATLVDKDESDDDMGNEVVDDNDDDPTDPTDSMMGVEEEDDKVADDATHV